MRQFDENLLREWIKTVETWRHEKPKGCWLGSNRKAVPESSWRFDIVYGKRVTDNLLRLLMLCLEAKVMPEFIRPDSVDYPVAAMAFFSCRVPWRPDGESFWIRLLTDGLVLVKHWDCETKGWSDFTGCGSGFSGVRKALGKLQSVMSGEAESAADEPAIVQS